MTIDDKWVKWWFAFRTPEPAFAEKLTDEYQVLRDTGVEPHDAWEQVVRRYAIFADIKTR